MAVPRPSAKSRARIWRRATLRALAALALLAVGLGSVLVLGLRSPAVRQAVLAWSAAAVEEAAGVRATAGDFSLGLLGGELVVEDLALAAPGEESRAFLTVRRARAVVSWRSLFGERLVVRSLELAEPRLDLEAPRPEPAEPAPEEPGDSRTDEPRLLDVEAFEVTGGTIVSGPLPAVLDVWLRSFRAEGVTVSGSYLGERLDAGLSAARLVAESPRRPPIEAALEASMTGDPRGRLTLDRLELEGEGLLLRALGAVDLAAAGRRPTWSGELTFELSAEPARLFPDLSSGGRVAGEGGLVLADGRLDGNLRLDVRQLPGELLAPALALAGAGAPDLGGTELDAVADLAVEAALAAADRRQDRLTGAATVDWRRGKEVLATAELSSLEGEGELPVHLGAGVRILPTAPGRRELALKLQAPGWLTLAEGELGETTVEVEEPDLGAALERLGLRRLAGGLRPAGELRATAELRGPLAGPEVQLEAAWLDDGETLAEIRVRSLDGPGLHLGLEGSLLPAAAGRRRFRGELLAAGAAALGGEDLVGVRLADARLDLEIPDLAAAAEELERRWQRLFPGRELSVPIPAGLLAGELAATVSGSGPVLRPRVELDAGWRPASGESLRLVARGDAASSPPVFTGQAFLEVAALEVARLASAVAAVTGEEEVSGCLSGSLDFAGSLDGVYSAFLALAIADLDLGGGSGVDELRLEARSDGSNVELPRLDGVLSTGHRFSAAGRLELGERSAGEALLRAGELRLELPPPLDTIGRVTAALRLEGGVAAVEIEAGAAGRALARVPLAALRARPELAAGLDALPLAADEGRVRLELANLTLDPFLPLLGLPEDGPRPRATFDGDLDLDLADLPSATGDLEISGLALEGEKGRLAAAEPWRIELRGRRLELRPARLLGSGPGGAVLEISGVLDLAAEIQPEESIESLFTHLDLRLDGSFESSVLEPFLGGGKASGEVTVALDVRGSPAAPVAAGRIDGSAMTLRYAAPYATKLEGPVVELSARPGGTALDALRARLNGGSLEVEGSLDQTRGLAVDARFRDVRYRLDHGLTVDLRGDLALRGPRPAEAGSGDTPLLSGEVVVERGALRRDLLVGREILSLLLAPDLSSPSAPALGDVDLDLEITTAEGVRIRNNLGDLRADWSGLSVRGTLASPLVAGRIDVDPGGKITAYGQTLRIDEAWVELAGDPAVGPRLVLETTSSLEDPSLKENRRGWTQTSLGDSGPGAGGYWEDRRAEGPEVSASDELTKGILTHYGDRLVGALAPAERTELGLEPLPIFGETDTQARLTATRRLSAQADLIYSVNPRDAEGQTYILDLHSFEPAPSLTAQVFTNDDDNEGVTLAQTLARGGGRRRAERAPRLAAVRLETPEGIDRRRLRRALGWRKGDPFPDDAAFDVEIDALEELRRQGYPGADVAVTVEPAGRRLDLGVALEPGPRVSFEFEGDRPPRPARRAVVQSYHPGDDRSAVAEASIAELRRETVKALRGEGYLEPAVEVTEKADATRSAESPAADSRTVTIRATGGRKIDPGPPELAGVAPAEAEVVAAQFSSTLARLELAAGEPGADAYLLQSLASLGYPEARIVSRRLADDGRRLTLDLETGPRQNLARVEILGVGAEEAARLAERVPIHAGEPARRDLVTRSAHAIEDALRERGYAEALVRTALEPESAGRPHDLTLRLTVEPGPLHRLAGVRFEGLRGASERWTEHTAGLEPGEIYRRQDVGAARRRLASTRVFERIVTDVEPLTDGPDEVATTVVFDLEERPRYLVTYGGRWESGEGAGVVVEAVDRNFLGRGTTLGLRAIAGADDRSLRLYHAIPRLRGSRAGLEVFVEGKDEEVDGCLLEDRGVDDCRIDGTESWVQLNLPLSRRTTHRVYLLYQDLVIREPGGEGGPGERVVIPSLGWQLSFDTRRRDRRDRAPDAQHVDGLAFGLDLSASEDALESDFSALGIFSQVKLFRTFGGGREAAEPERWAWAQSFRLGLLEPSGDATVPAVSRLRAGGAYSVRGYKTDSLGPLDAEGNALGGEVFFIVNEELHFPLPAKRLSGLVFFDAGNVWASRATVEADLVTSLGVGLRASTPAGPLRLDVAFPLDRRPGIDDSFEVYFGFGNVF